MEINKDEIYNEGFTQHLIRANIICGFQSILNNYVLEIYNEVFSMYSKKKGKKGQWAQLQMQKKNRSV
jgi:hypothetical protein